MKLDRTVPNYKEAQKIPKWTYRSNLRIKKKNAISHLNSFPVMEFNYDYTHVKLYCQEFKKKHIRPLSSMMNLKIRENIMNTGRKSGLSLCLCLCLCHTHTHIYFTLLPADYRILVSSLLGDKNSLEGRFEGS